MKVVVLSDTHGNFYNIDMPEGDILIVAGDWSAQGGMYACITFNKWLNVQPFKHKLYIPGNHELGFEQNPSLENLITAGININKKLITIEGINFFGYSYTLPFNNWAFAKNENLQEYYFKTIAPEKVDILVTHGPPYGILDGGYEENNLGSKALLEYVKEIEPKLHVFGHIHEGYGINKTAMPNTTFANVSLVDTLAIINKPMVFKI